MVKTSKITPAQIAQLKLYLRLSQAAVVIFLLVTLLLVSRLFPALDTYVSSALIAVTCILPAAFIGLFTPLIIKTNSSAAAMTFLNALGFICGIAGACILLYLLMLKVTFNVADPAWGSSLIAGALILLLTPGLVVWFARDRKI